jgi:hypothetical protein
MALTAEIMAMRAGEGDPAALVGEFRRTAVLVPVTDDGLMSGYFGGIRWLYAFTDETALARFAQARGLPPVEEVEYRAVLGARLLDVVIPQTEGPTGVAVDVGDDGTGMLFPPVRGIVPDEAAVDAQAEETDAAGKGSAR